MCVLLIQGDDVGGGRRNTLAIEQGVVGRAAGTYISPTEYRLGGWVGHAQILGGALCTNSQIQGLHRVR